MSPRRYYCYLLIVFGFAGWNATAQALVVEASGVPKSELMATDAVQIKINEGYAALRAQQAGMAEKAFLEANRLNPTAVEALLGLAMVAQFEGKAEKAREWMASAVSAAPNRPEIHQAEARLYADQGNLDIAATRYRKAISTFPDNSQLRLDLANLYLEKIRKPGEAINVLRDLISRNPNFAAGHLALGLAFSADGKLDESIRALSDAAKLDSSNPFIFHALGLLALRQGAPDRALDAFDKALALRADFAGAAIGRGDALAALGKTDKAIEAYQRAARLSPQSALPHAMRAQLLERQKRFDEAESAYREALKAEPEHALVMNNLAYLLVQRKSKLDEALSLAQRAVAANPAVAGYYDTLGMAQLARGDGASAHKSFEKALALNPGNAKYREHLSLASTGTASKPAVSAAALKEPTPAPAPPVKVVAALTVAEMKPAAAVALAPAKEVVDDPAKVIGPRLEGWRQAWEAKDVDRYLSFYSKDFVPPARKSTAVWAADRRVKLEKKGEIKVRVLNPFFMLSGNVATVVFEQQYQSSNFSDAGGKRLEWVKEGNEWRIRREGPR